MLKATREGALHFYLDGEYRPRAVVRRLHGRGCSQSEWLVNAAGLIIREEDNA